MDQARQELLGVELPTLEQVPKFLMHLKELFSKTTLLNIYIANATEHMLPFWLIEGTNNITKRRDEETSNMNMMLRDAFVKTKNVYLTQKVNGQTLLLCWMNYGMLELWML